MDLWGIFLWIFFLMVEQGFLQGWTWRFDTASQIPKNVFSWDSHGILLLIGKGIAVSLQGSLAGTLENLFKKKTGCWICSSFRVQPEFTFGDFLQVLGCPRIVHWCSMDLYGSVNLSSHHLQCTAAQLGEPGEPHTPFAGPFSCLEGSTVLGKNRFLSWCSLQISKE